MFHRESFMLIKLNFILAKSNWSFLNGLNQNGNALCHHDLLNIVQDQLIAMACGKKTEMRSLFERNACIASRWTMSFAYAKDHTMYTDAKTSCCEFKCSFFVLDLQKTKKNNLYGLFT